MTTTMTQVNKVDMISMSCNTDTRHEWHAAELASEAFVLMRVIGRACNRAIAFGGDLTIGSMMGHALEVTRPQAAPLLLWRRQRSATFVMALNIVYILAVNAILVVHVGKTRRRTLGRTPFGFLYNG